MKRILLLGSTGSVGLTSLNVIAGFSDRLKVVGLSTNRNIDILKTQVDKFSPEAITIVDEEKASEFRNICPNRLKVFSGDCGLNEIVSFTKPDLVIMAISGSKALVPLLKVIGCARSIALANKEALVMAGSIIMDKAREFKTQILPVDSEQSAIFQCLEGRDRNQLKKIYLTASGGPLHNLSQEAFESLTVKKVLKHPRWKMGKKISVDSATLMNKGLELIEACWLFAISPSSIDILIHKEAIIHSMVEFIDGTVIAQLGITDMSLPIQYALTFPERWPSKLESIDFLKIKSLNFSEPDLKKFPCLKAAMEAAKTGGTAPCALNAANEEAVGAFLRGEIKFNNIFEVIRKTLDKHKVNLKPSLEEIYESDNLTRKFSKEIIRKIG